MLLSAEHRVKLVELSVLSSCVHDESEIQNEASELLDSLESISKVKKFFSMESLCGRAQRLEDRIFHLDRHLQSVLAGADGLRYRSVREVLNRDMVRVEKIGMTHQDIAVLKRHGNGDLDLGRSLRFVYEKYRFARAFAQGWHFRVLSLLAGNAKSIYPITAENLGHPGESAALFRVIELNDENEDLKRACEYVIAKTEHWTGNTYKAVTQYQRCVKEYSDARALDNIMSWFIDSSDYAVQRVVLQTLQFAQQNMKMDVGYQLALAGCYERGFGTRVDLHTAAQLYSSIESAAIE